MRDSIIITGRFMECYVPGYTVEVVSPNRLCVADQVEVSHPMSIQLYDMTICRMQTADNRC